MNLEIIIIQASVGASTWLAHFIISGGRFTESPLQFSLKDDVGAERILRLTCIPTDFNTLPFIRAGSSLPANFAIVFNTDSRSASHERSLPRLMTALINALETTDSRYGLQTMCCGGMATATVIERIEG